MRTCCAAAAAVQAERTEARNACCPYRQPLWAMQKNAATNDTE